MTTEPEIPSSPPPRRSSAAAGTRGGKAPAHAEAAPTQAKPAAPSHPAPAESAASKRPAARKPRTPQKPAGPLPPLHGSLFFDRDESWLKFNERVLEEAADPANPLLERVKFLAITASNLDEFVEIRLGGMLQRLEDGLDLAGAVQGGPDGDGLTPAERLSRLSGSMAAFVAAQYRCWNELLLPALGKAGIRLRRWDELRGKQRAFAEAFYADEVDPLLTPVTIDPSHPFPRVLNKALCIALLLRHKRRAADGSKRGSVLGVVTVPRSLPRVICLPSPGAGRTDYILLHEVIEAQASRMFRGYEVMGRAAFRVTRNSNLYMQEEESRSLLESVREELHNRRKGDAVRLEIEASADDALVERLRVNFELEPAQVFRTPGPVNLSRLMQIYSETNRSATETSPGTAEARQPALKFPPFAGRALRLSPGVPDLFAELREHDVLLHHPFDSYRTVEDFIAAGARDPGVLSIKQTLYRTSKDSPIFRALIEAADARDQPRDVTVVVELMARFDEDSNIRWARELEDAGVGVFHGILGFKTHCKLALLVRRDPDGVVRRYAHLGTGNYNPVTARFYTDLSLLTARPELTCAVQAVFRYLTAGAVADEGAYRPLLVAPLTLAADVLELIAREAAHARAGRPARIVAKMNALLDRKTVEALYAASQAGVEIDLIVRGMCSLRPGVAGLSERIRVRSVVGEFLEHSRIFLFGNDGRRALFLGSADWMARNLYERCEVLFPVEDEALVARVADEILGAYLRDDLKARELGADGVYRRVARKGAGFSAQQWLMELAQASAPSQTPPPPPPSDAPRAS